MYIVVKEIKRLSLSHPFYRTDFSITPSEVGVGVKWNSLALTCMVETLTWLKQSIRRKMYFAGTGLVSTKAYLKYLITLH